MTYLQLCKKLRQEASVSGEGPATTINQTGEMKRLISWIDDAYEEIQNMRRDWFFLTKDFSFALTNNVSTYPASTVSDLMNWKSNSFRVYQTSVGIIDELRITHMDYETYFRDAREYGSVSTVTGRPIEFSIKPDKSAAFFPIPDSTGYTVRGRYYAKPDVLSGDADTPIFPEQFHKAIVWKALSYYAKYESAQELLAQAEQNFATVYSKLVLDQSPRLRAGRPLC